MKNRLSLFALTALVAWLNGCQTAPPLPEAVAPPTTRNNCYSLLHQLLEEQKNVGLLRFIKREDPDVKNLIKKIAAVSSTGAKLLERFAREDRSIVLDDVGLPPGEVLARDAIAATKKKELLGNSGGEFELALLLTQTEALNYGWHLAQVAARQETQPERARALTGLGQEMENLYREVVARLQLRRPMN
jgi:hypothetical protein